MTTNISKLKTPVFVYSKQIIKQNYTTIKNSFHYKHLDIHYAIMGNHNVNILKYIKQLGIGAQIQSIEELNLVKRLGFNKKYISFTSSGESKSLLKRLIKEEIILNLESIEALIDFGIISNKLNSSRKVGIRIYLENISHSKNTINSSEDSNIGISLNQISKVHEICKRYNIKIIGIHGYIGSNITSFVPFKQLANILYDVALRFPDIEYINFGSGFGVSSEYNPNKLDFKKVSTYYSKIITKISLKLNKDIRLKIEPCRYLLSNAGIFFTKVTRVKQINNIKQVYVDSGFGEFARPYIYGYNTNGYHEIINYSNLNSKKKELVNIRANTVLQTDIFGKDRLINTVNEGNILGLLNTGCYSMSSGFPNLRPKARHILV